MRAIIVNPLRCGMCWICYWQMVSVMCGRILSGPDDPIGMGESIEVLTEKARETWWF